MEDSRNRWTSLKVSTILKVDNGASNGVEVDDGNEQSKKVSGRQETSMAVETNAIRRVDNDGSRARKRDRQSYRDSSSSTFSSTSFDDSSSTDNEEETSREKRFTNILSEMIRKTGGIVDEQVIANVILIKTLEKSVNDLRKEVKDLI